MLMDRRLFLAACFGLTTLALGGRAGEPAPGEIRRLIERLGSRKFKEREAASRALEKIGEKALPALRNAAREHRDAEVRRRAQAAVRSLTNAAVRRELARLRGTWRVVGFSADGKFRPASSPGERWEIQGNVVLWLDPEDEDNAFRCHLDPMATPRVMDFVLLGDPSGAAVARGIYRLDGDRLRVCYGGPGEPRPSKFGSAKDSDQFVLFLTRVRRPKYDRSRGDAKAH
jgi:uncharacterized protein (TIGR03067 family)